MEDGGKAGFDGCESEEQLIGKKGRGERWVVWGSPLFFVWFVLKCS